MKDDDDDDDDDDERGRQALEGWLRGWGSSIVLAGVGVEIASLTPHTPKRAAQGRKIGGKDGKMGENIEKKGKIDENDEKIEEEVCGVVEGSVDGLKRVLGSLSPSR
jgi:hypothetical protein